jgi:Tol biopolymer transport system component
MSNHEPLRFTVSEEALRRALRPSPDLAAPADFALMVGDAIARQPQQRRGWGVFGGGWSSPLGRFGQLVLIAALLLALVIGAVIAGSLRDRPPASGSLVVALSNQLSVIDPRTGVSKPLLDDQRGIFGVTRSADGGFVSFWTGTPDQPGTTLEVVRVDGGGRRVLATNVAPAPVSRGGIDTWSGDGQYLAAAVTVAGVHRLLVVDVASGEGRLVGPDTGASNPLWSPDGEWLAFTHEHAGGAASIAVVRRDGSGLREIATGLDAYVSGPDTWSADGRWIYFDAGRTRPPSQDVYRVEVATGRVEQLTSDETAAAPALSPDGGRVAFLVWADTPRASVWVMNADGSSPRLLVEDADLRGWSPDGHYLLVVTPAHGSPVQLLAITPDGKERRVLLTLDTCADPCLESLSWGLPRP